MTLGGLSLAVGILVDEATVEVENIHSQMEHTDSVAEAVRRGNAETAVPRLLAMLCILAVFLPVFAMEGAVRNMFVPLALAVGFSMITCYLLSSMFVPVISVWLLRRHGHRAATVRRASGISGASSRHTPASLQAVVHHRKTVVVGYLAASVGSWCSWGAGSAGRSSRRSTPGSSCSASAPHRHADRADRGDRPAGPGCHRRGCRPRRGRGHGGLRRVTPPTFPNQSVYLWTRGPEEAVLRIALKHDSGVRVEARSSPGSAANCRSGSALAGGEMAERGAGLRRGLPATAGPPLLVRAGRHRQ